MKKLFNKEDGFTIIEVVLVLAIAGLIFLVVFLALPQLQRSRRDTQRKSDAGRAVAALESYAGNNNGAYPDNAAAFTADIVPAYLTKGGSTWSDPSTGVTYTQGGGAPIDINALGTGEYWYQEGAFCDGQQYTTTGAGGRAVAFMMFLESGGQYCQDNR